MIAISGIDGAGKSTQIELLKKAYEKNGQKVFIFWSRGGYTPGMEKLKSFLRKKKNSHITEKRGKSVNRSELFSKSYIRKTWLILSILDLIYNYTVNLRIKKLTGKKIIFDRYIYDTYIDFKLNFPDDGFEKWFLWKFLNFFALNPEKQLILIISVEESLKRSKLKGEPFPDDEKTLKSRLEFYKLYIENYPNVIKIDCNNKISEVSMKINKEVFN